MTVELALGDKLEQLSAQLQYSLEPVFKWKMVLLEMEFLTMLIAI